MSIAVANKLFFEKKFHEALEHLNDLDSVYKNTPLEKIINYNKQYCKRKLGLAPLEDAPGIKVQCDTKADSLTTAAPTMVQPSGSMLLEELYREADNAARNVPRVDALNAPLVSVLMTAHDVAGYIEAGVTSVLRQTWPRLELIVVDDASSDETWTILQRLQKAEPGMRCRRLNTNLGTYFAKNYALTLAGGDFIFFQDGDDLCHPARIQLSMEQLMQDGVLCVRGVYSRVLFPTGQVLPVNGILKKLGFITLGVRRRVFDHVGLFNCTSKASDDEFFQRLKAWTAIKGGEIRDLHLPLYYTSLREGSLFTDMITNNPASDGRIEQHPSPSRKQYVEAFTRTHRELGVEGFKRFFRYPVIRDLIPVKPSMSYLPNPALNVVASLCSIPERAEMLRMTLASLVPQVDALHLYLDRYENVPFFVKSYHPRVKVVLSRDVPGLRDNGKFLSLAAQDADCYYFTADDDIVYPPDYVATMIRRIEFYGQQAVVGVHGVLVPEQAEGYFSSYRKVLLFNQGLERDALVNNLGTGTVAFHSTLLRGLDLNYFREAGMVDLYLSVFCKQRQIPMVAIARPDDWLMAQAASLKTPNPSLYDEFCQYDNAQAALIREHRPWGYAAISEAVEGARKRTADLKVCKGLGAMVPDLHVCLR